MTNIFFRGFRLIRYLLLSRYRKGEGIHSPFVFDVVLNVFRNKIDPVVVLHIETIRRKNIEGDKTVEMKDLGAGSEKMKTGRRKISDITRFSSVPPRYGFLLLNMAKRFGGDVIAELGTSVGISAMYLASGNPGAKVYTVEGCPSLSDVAMRNITDSGISNIELLNMSFDEALSVMADKNINPGLVFIDGSHSKEPVIRYFSFFAGKADNDTVIIIDDIHQSQQMEEAWNEIISSENITSTIDIFRMGIVFFRKGLTKQNYVIRY